MWWSLKTFLVKGDLGTFSKVPFRLSFGDAWFFSLPGYGAVEDWIWTSSRSSNSIGASSLGCSRKECSLIKVSFTVVEVGECLIFFPPKMFLKMCGDVWLIQNTTFRIFDQKSCQILEGTCFLSDASMVFSHTGFPMPPMTPPSDPAKTNGRT